MTNPDQCSKACDEQHTYLGACRMSMSSLYVRAAALPPVSVDVEPSSGLKAMQLWRRLTGRRA